MGDASPPPRRAAWLITLSLGVALVLWAAQRPLAPGPHDPLRRLEGRGGSSHQVLHGTLLADPHRHPDGSCQVLLQTSGGRTELVLRPCRPLQEGWRVRASGVLKRPPPASHPLLAGPAERLARQGAWTRLRVDTLEVLARPATPGADLRRRIAAQFLEGAGPERGGLLAALVSAETLKLAPWGAASIITPMMLLALILRLPRVSQTSHLKLDASCETLAEGRACSPSLLTRLTSASVIKQPLSKAWPSHKSHVGQLRSLPPQAQQVPFGDYPKL